MRGQHIGVGMQGEDAAVAWLESKGWRILSRGERIAGVEVDAVAADPAGRALVVVEVKCRRDSAGVARPEENVNRGKIHRLARAAHALQRPAARRGLSVRVDVVAVSLGDAGPGSHRIVHFPDVAHG